MDQKQWDELKRLRGASAESVKRQGVHWRMVPHTDEMAEFRNALVEAWPSILAERSAAQRFINHVEGEVACYLGSGDDGVIGDANVLRAVTIMHKRKMAADNFYRRIKEISDSGDCGKMLEDAIAAFDKETQNEG